MRLYPKKLRNIEDLEREKSRLLKAKRSLDKDEFLSGSLFGNKKGGEGKKGKEGQGSLLDFLPISNPAVAQLIKIAQRLIFKKSGKPGSGDNAGAQLKKRGKSLLKSFAKEFIGGYLKWKAIELTFKGIRHIIRSKAKDQQSED